jgi:SAM-dependent methyltransferase
MLCGRYESVDFQMVHKSWLPLIPLHSSTAIDIGCGSGRDAEALSKAGFQVLAVDSSPDMVREAERLHANSKIEWLVDSLPELPLVLCSGSRFDLILLSAVWMHLTNPERSIAMGNLSKLCAPRGILVITLRHPVDHLRGMNEASGEEISALAAQNHLEILQRFTTEDALGRTEVTWSFIVLTPIGTATKPD